MTIICAMHDPKAKCTWIGSDTMSISAGAKLRSGPKWVVSEGWAVGLAGSWRAMNLIQSNAGDLLHRLSGVDDLTLRLKKIFDDEDFNTDNDVGPKCYGQEMIAATPGGVWFICDALSYTEKDGLWAGGSGRDYALGVAFARHGRKPRDIVRASIEGAIFWARGCGGEPWIHKLA